MKKCPICDSDRDKLSLCKVSFTFNTVFDLLECKDCGLIYIDPLPTKEQFVAFYSIGGDAYNRWRQESKADAYIKELNLRKKGGRFLDIGCATGCFINKIEKSSDWDVYGVELNEVTAKFARDVLGLKNIHHGELHDAAYDDAFFDCIHVSDVLEHVPSPIEFLLECRRILKPDGRLYLMIPNGYSDSRGLIEYYNRYNEAGCHASGHVFFFPPRTLEMLLEKTGFKIEKSYTSDIKQGLRNIGLLPKKRGWKNFYEPRRKPEVPLVNQIKLIEDKKYPEIYYKYRYARKNWIAVPGLHDYGLNFKLVASPF